MAKVVKFCAVCEEGFAEKFGFCPNCGGALAAYEMNPVAEKTNVGAPGNVEAKASAPILNESPAVAEKTAEPVIETFSTNGDETEFSGDESFPEAEASEISDPVPVRSSFNQDFGRSAYRQNANGASNGSQKTVTTTQTNYDDGAYHITFVEEKNASGRNMLLLGSLLLVTAMALGGVVYSLFERNLSIGSLGDDVSMLAYIGPVEPEPLIEEEPPKKNKDDGGGGGGGGKENPEPATKGRLPNQVDKPVMPPQPLPQLTNPTLANPNETQGKIKRDKTDEPVGVPTGSLASRLSSGGGSGGGIGSGRGSGVGGGIGTGEGNGIGSGSGNGNGNGNGDGNGDGDGGAPPAVKKPVVAVTEPFRIISRPRPPYTDAARQNQVTGVVRVRVTFLASGQVGSVSAVNGLPYGLTEQAIAAAKGIKFEPAKRNGVPVPTTKVIEYNFSIY
jgi:TonB family protein